MNRHSIEKNKIRVYYYLGSISAVLFILISISGTYSHSLTQEYQRKIEQLSSGIINEKKRFLKNAVDRTITMINCDLKQMQQESASKKLNPEYTKKSCIDLVSRHIRELRLIDNGYVWVNKVVNYDGGDKYAIRQIHPNLPHTEGDWLSTNTEDIKGNKPYKIELDGIKKDGEIYFEYYFKKMDSNKIAHKMSYAKLYKPLDWIVATGVYLDDVDQLVKIERIKMEETLNKQRNYSFSIAIIAFAFSAFILSRFEKQISSLLRAYEVEIKDYTTNLIEEKEKTERALTEVKQLRGLIPICSTCKKIRDDTGYWNNLELFIEKHSDASFSHGMCPECSDKLYGSQDWYIDMKKKKEKD